MAQEVDTSSLANHLGKEDEPDTTGLHHPHQDSIAAVLGARRVSGAKQAFGMAAMQAEVSRQRQKQIKPLQPTPEAQVNLDPSGHHAHPSVALLATHKRVSAYKSKGVSFEDESPAQGTIAVLDEAELAKKGKDFWENGAAYSGVDANWWRQQLAWRKALKRVHNQSMSRSGGMPLDFGTPELASNDSNSMPPMGDYDSSTVRIRDLSSMIGMVSDDDRKTKENAGHSPDPPSVDVGAGESSPVSMLVKSPVGTSAPTGFQHEYQDLLEDYRQANKMLLEAEREKAAKEALLNEQRALLGTNQRRIQEMERQMEDLRKTVTEASQSSAAAVSDMGINREQLRSDLKVIIREDIVREVNTNVEKQSKDGLAALRAEFEKMKETQIALEVQQRLAQAEEERRRLLEAQKSEYESRMRELESKLHKHESDVTRLELENKDLDTRQKRAENELSKSRSDFERRENDLMSNIVAQQSRSNPLDDESNNGSAMGGGASASVNVNLQQHTPSTDDTDDAPLLSKGKNRSVKRLVGVDPPEYFMKRKWCCGVVCCGDNACGLGWY